MSKKIILFIILNNVFINKLFSSEDNKKNLQNLKKIIEKKETPAAYIITDVFKWKNNDAAKAFYNKEINDKKKQ